MKIRVFRPLLSLGVIVIALAIFSFLLAPSWRGSPIGILILLIALIIGGAAVALDVRNLLREFRALRRGQDQDDGAPPRD